MNIKYNQLGNEVVDFLYSNNYPDNKRYCILDNFYNIKMAFFIFLGHFRVERVPLPEEYLL